MRDYYATNFVDGNPEEATTGKTFASVDPFLRRPWARAALSDEKDTDRVVKCARSAFLSGNWASAPATERAAVLHRVADAIEAHRDELAEAETRDCGCPRRGVSEGNVSRAAANFRFFADYSALAEERMYPRGGDQLAYTRQEPVGVAVIVSPWNYPLALSTWKIAPALAFGNSTILKPAEQTPVTASMLAHLMHEAGVPRGVFNVVQGYGADGVGEQLSRHPDVDLVSLTGSTDTGRTVLRHAADSLKGVSLELGGKGPAVVYADAAWESTIKTILRGAFTNSGQMCLSVSRIYVERPVYQRFVDEFHVATHEITMGNPLDDEVDLGPLVSAEHWEKVRSYLRLGASQGARLLPTRTAPDGWFVAPSVFIDADEQSALCKDEIFGPVVTICPFDNDDQAVSLANDTRYGLTAALFTSDLARAHRTADRLRAGTVWINCFYVRDFRAPFGGYQTSGIGREGGRESQEFFTEAKSVFVSLDGK